MEVHRDQTDSLSARRPDRIQQACRVSSSSPELKWKRAGIVRQLSQELYSKKDSPGSSGRSWVTSRGHPKRFWGNFTNLLVMTRRRQCHAATAIAWFRALVDAFVSNLTIRVASKCDTADREYPHNYPQEIAWFISMAAVMHDFTNSADGIFVLECDPGGQEQRTGGI